MIGAIVEGWSCYSQLNSILIGCNIHPKVAPGTQGSVGARKRGTLPRRQKRSDQARRQLGMKLHRDHGNQSRPGTGCPTELTACSPLSDTGDNIWEECSQVICCFPQTRCGASQDLFHSVLALRWSLVPRPFYRWTESQQVRSCSRASRLSAARQEGETHCLAFMKIQNPAHACPQFIQAAGLPSPGQDGCLKTKQRCPSDAFSCQRPVPPSCSLLPRGHAPRLKADTWMGVPSASAPVTDAPGPL